jgi:hypothetical protein
MQPAQEGVVLPEVPGQCLHQLGDLGAHPGFGHLGQHVHVPFTLDQRTEHGPPGDSEDVRGHAGEFDPGVFEFLFQSLGLPGTFRGQGGPVAGEITQVPDRLTGERTTP